MTDIIKFISKTNLETDIEQLRMKISSAILEHDDLMYIQCKNIETSYFLSFGSLEAQIYKVEILCSRLHRKLSLLISARNHKIVPDLDRIEKQLEEEFLDYQNKLDEFFYKMDQALERSMMNVLTEEESQNHKKLYRKIVKHLHPDLNPDISEAQERLYIRAVEAYEKGMTSVLEMIAETLDVPNKTDFEGPLIDEKKRLELIVRQLLLATSKIKEDYPYRFKEILKNDETRLAHRKKLEERLFYYQERIEHYEEELSFYL